MGGILHLFEFNQAGTSRKLLTHKRHADGLEAPRNSLELPTETSCHQVMRNSIPYSYQVKQHSSKTNFYPGGTPMKKLIDDEMSKPVDSKRNVPSVVARLMGMDMLPGDIQPIVHAKERGNESTRSNVPRTEAADNPLTHLSPFVLKPVKETKQHILPQSSRLDPDKSKHSLKVSKPRPREHPQEEQLQKFKKEFEAWQASKIWECSKTVELGGNPRSWKDNQILAQENLNKEKMALYADSRRFAFHEKPIELSDHTLQYKSNTSTEQIGGLSHFQPNRKEAKSFRNKIKTNGNFEQINQMNCNEKYSRTLPTRIVILKPGLQRSSDTEESWPGSSEITEEEGSIEDFLEEVKERLRYEIKGNVRTDTPLRGGGNETPFHERPTDPKEIARHIAKNVRENVTRDLGMNLLRSESTRSYRSEVQFNGPDSPEFINRDTRKFLSERLRNVLRNEIEVDIPAVTNRTSTTSVINNEIDHLGTRTFVSRAGKRVGHWENLKNMPAMKTGSFRHQQMTDGLLDSRDASPRNLIRSLSAPVPGTSFGKLLLEEPRVLTGAHIRRKHEATEVVSVEVRKTRKEKFSFRGKVSNLRHSLTLRGKLFGKKVQIVEDSRPRMSDSTKAFMTAPSVLMNLGFAQENSTEVPPSPASVCSSVHDEFTRPGDHPSPVFTLDVPLIEDHHMPQVFKEISSNLHELRRQLNHLHFDGSKEAVVEANSPAANMDSIEGQAQAYIREILIASGLYDGSSSSTCPIDSLVFEQVEDTYRKRGKENEGTVKDGSDDTNVDHKMLFDLVNEALSTVVARPGTGPIVMKRANVPMSYGRRLLDNVWRMIRVYVYPPVDRFHSLDGMVVHELKTARWTALLDGEIDVLGREMEWMLLEELIEEATRDMCC